MAGTTKTSNIECSNIVQKYWRSMGLSLAAKTLTTSMHAGIKVTRPDYWVVRVNLAGLRNESELSRLLRCITSHGSSLVREHARATEVDARSRYFATGAGSQERRYVNVAASYRADPRLEGVKASFVESGFEARITPGPLLLATTGGLGGKLKLMPFQPGGASCPVKEILTEAAKRVAAEGIDHDLEVAPDREPKWSSHSLRRLADTVARRHREAMGVSEAEIDIYFGWHERVLLKEMQVHYEAMSPRERMLHAKITGMM